MSTTALASRDQLIQALYTRAMDRAAMLTGLRGRARRNAEIERSLALQVERLQCADLDDAQLRERLAR